MDTTRKCPYCAEEIRVEAVRCRYCRRRVGDLDPARWRRDHAERRVGGVAAAIGSALAVPTAAVRVGFIVLTFFHFLGPIAYAALWSLIPFTPGEPSPLERGLATAADWAGRLAGQRPDPPPAAGAAPARPSTLPDGPAS